MTDENVMSRAPEEVLKKATIVVIPVAPGKHRVVRYTVWGEEHRVEVMGLSRHEGVVNFETHQAALDAANDWAKETHEATGTEVEVRTTEVVTILGDLRCKHQLWGWHPAKEKGTTIRFCLDCRAELPYDAEEVRQHNPFIHHCGNPQCRQCNEYRNRHIEG